MLKKTSFPYFRSVSIWKISSSNISIMDPNNILHPILSYLSDTLLTVSLTKLFRTYGSYDFTSC